MQSFVDLNCWKEAKAFRIACFNLVSEFPQEEKYRLADQLIRSSRSIGNAIAEGHGRYHYQENIQYCKLARGSLTESLDHLFIAQECGYLTEKKLKEFEEHHSRLLALLNGYIKYLIKRRDEK